MRKSDYAPRVLINFIKRMQCENYLYYSGSYSTWNEADEAVKKYGKGYESDNIIKQVAEATQAVRRGEAEYEQDGKLYYETNNVYEFLASLFYVISNSERVEICDFGGALGSAYFRYRNILPMNKISWNVVEQKHYVDYGKKNVPEIDFFYSIEDCYKEKNVNVVLLGGVLPFFDKPYEYLERIFAGGVKYIIIDQTAFNIDENEDEHIVLQHVPSSIYKAVYPSHIFNRKKVINYFETNGYKKVFEWIYPQGAIPTITRFGFKENVDRGFLFEKV